MIEASNGSIYGGIHVIKSDMLPSDTIVVSQDIFDMIKTLKDLNDIKIEEFEQIMNIIKGK